MGEAQAESSEQAPVGLQEVLAPRLESEADHAAPMQPPLLEGQLDAGGLLAKEAVCLMSSPQLLQPAASSGQAAGIHLDGMRQPPVANGAAAAEPPPPKVVVQAVVGDDEEVDEFGRRRKRKAAAKGRDKSDAAKEALERLYGRKRVREVEAGEQDTKPETSASVEVSAEAKALSAAPRWVPPKKPPSISQAAMHPVIPARPQAVGMSNAWAPSSCGKGGMIPPMSPAVRAPQPAWPPIAAPAAPPATGFGQPPAACNMSDHGWSSSGDWWEQPMGKGGGCWAEDAGCYKGGGGWCEGAGGWSHDLGKGAPWGGKQYDKGGGWGPSAGPPCWGKGDAGKDQWGCGKSGYSEWP